MASSRALLGKVVQFVPNLRSAHETVPDVLCPQPMQYAVGVMRHVHLAILLSVTLLPVSLVAQQPCTADATAMQLRAAQADLLKTKVGDNETEVSATLQKQIKSLKDAIALTIDMEMSCTPPEAAATGIEASLDKPLAGTNAPSPKSAKEDGIGSYAGKAATITKSPAHSATSLTMLCCQLYQEQSKSR